jgi:hypothetical protein
MNKLQTFSKFKRLLTLALFAPALLCGQTKSVLWLGNSYTASNNLPGLFYMLALSGGDTVTFDSYTPGGYTLEDHWNSLTSQTRITQQPWDYVVLQAQSQEPSLDSAFVTNWVLPYADALDSVIHLNDSCTQTVFYMTWGRKNGDAQNCAAHPPVCTYQGMQDQLRNRYLQMAHDNDAMVAPCGEAWRDAIAATPAFNLYIADESHPSLHGSYLNACVFYASIFRRTPVGLSYYGGLPQADALFLQQIAATTVLDSMSVWNTEVYYDDPAFYPNSMGGTTYLFVSDTTASGHEWNFGNGFVPGSAYETYTFPPAGGTFLVTHVTNNGCLTDTASQWITVTPQGIWNCIPEQKLVLYPVPAAESLTLHNPFSATEPGLLEIFDSNGNVVLSSACTGELICVPVANLPNGAYIIKITQHSQQVSRSFMISHQ